MRFYQFFLFLFVLTAGVLGGVSYSVAEQDAVERSVAEVLQGSVEAEAVVSNTYRLRVSDTLTVFVYGEKELTGDYEVGPDGSIVFPLIGAVHVEGLMLSQVEVLLKERFGEGYLVDPNITVSVASHSPFYILGEVRIPGSYGYVSNMSVLKAVAIAGGFTYRADRKKVEILRFNGDNSVSSSYEEMPVQTSVEPGDIILVKERFF